MKVRVPSVLVYGIGTFGTHGTRTFDSLYFFICQIPAAGRICL